ncbi:TIM21 protein [Ostertagia ostertagi]
MYIDYTAMQPYFVRCWLVSDAPNMSSALFLRLGNTTVTRRLKVPWVAYSPRVLLRQPLDHRWLCGTRNFAEKRGTIAPQNKEQTGLQRSVLEEVAEKASNTFLYTAVAAAIGMLGVFVYLLAGEFFAEDSPQKIYSSALSLVREDGRCHDLFGPTIAGFGEETSRGRRRHGERDEGIAQAEMEQRDGEWQWRFLYVETKRRPKTTHMEDDGFELVRRKRRHARLKKTALASVSRIEGTVDDIQAAMEKTNSQVEDSGLRANATRVLLKRRWSNAMLLGSLTRSAGSLVTDAFRVCT